MAAKPYEPPMDALRNWLRMLEDAIKADDRATIRSILVEAVPEFGGSGRLVSAVG